MPPDKERIDEVVLPDARIAGQRRRQQPGVRRQLGRAQLNEDLRRTAAGGPSLLALGVHAAHATCSALGESANFNPADGER